MSEIIEDLVLPEDTIPPAPGDSLGGVQAPVLLEVRKPQYNRIGTIDCEVLHSEHGWIPFTANSTDREAYCRELFAAFLRGDHGTIAECPLKSVAQQKAEIADRRYNEEISGIIFSGMAIDTGRDSQGLITGATLASVLDPSYVCNWKTPTGFVELNASTLAAVSQAVRAHVQACFDREAELITALDNGTFNEGMLEEGWPE